MMLSTSTDDPRELAACVADALESRGHDEWDSSSLAYQSTPLVLDVLKTCDVTRWHEDRRYRRHVRREVRRSVRAGLGIWTWILWRLVIPIVLRWIIEWYVSPRGQAMRMRFRAEPDRQ